MIETPGESTQRRDLPSQTIVITVKVNRVYSLEQAIAIYSWVPILIVLVVLGVIGLRKGYLGVLGRGMPGRDAGLGTDTSEPELASLRHQLAEKEEDLRLIQERKSEHVMDTAIPLDLIKQERRTQKQIEGLKQRIGELEQSTGGELE